MERGAFITLEGGEGSGKSTQAKKLAEFLRKKGYEVVLTREVGGCPSAEEIRDLWLGKGEGHWDAMTELMLIMAARREHLAKTIWPALERSAWVISDRFIDSTRAYQGVGLKMGTGVVDHIYHHIAGDFEPDLTLLLDLPVEEGLARMKSRKGPDDRYQQKDQSFHQTLRDAYLALAEKYPQRFRIIDASRDADKVAKAIQDAVQKHDIMTA
ncbi:MAG: dTMP kinase [Alphaproteobacteria bacterium]|nr:dTMP kinase [Alphaproteobacteria bacterium]